MASDNISHKITTPYNNMDISDDPNFHTFISDGASSCCGQNVHIIGDEPRFMWVVGVA